MGKASRGKKQRSRDQATQWSAVRAAQAAHRARRETLKLLPGNPYVRALLSRNTHDAVTDTYRVVTSPGSDIPEDKAWDFTASAVLGKQGMRPPWPATAEPVADWHLEQAEKLLQRAEVFVISPAAHAAVMAAATTLEVADTLTLDTNTDLIAHHGIVVLPQPLIVENRSGSLSDIAAWGWTRCTLYSTYPQETYPGARITAFMDRDGPVQNESWRAHTTAARQSGHRLPRWVPDGSYGLRGDAKLADEDPATLAELSEGHRQVQGVFRQAARMRSSLPPDTGEWAGEAVADPHDDFTHRYLFAFWRLAAHGTTTAAPAPFPETHPSPAGDGATTSPGVRVINLTAPSIRSGTSTEATGTSAYHHRWPVRMHKVRQWYPSLGQHKVIWRGPYIKGPHQAPLLLRDTAYKVDV